MFRANLFRNADDRREFNGQRTGKNDRDDLDGRSMRILRRSNQCLDRIHIRTNQNDRNPVVFLQRRL